MALLLHFQVLIRKSSVASSNRSEFEAILSEIQKRHQVKISPEEEVNFGGIVGLAEVVDWERRILPSGSFGTVGADCCKIRGRFRLGDAKEPPDSSN